MTTKRSLGVMKMASYVGLIALVVGAKTRAQESEIRLDQVPKAVITATKDKFPGAEHRSAAKETEDGKTVYEMAITHKGHKMDVTFKEDGTLVSIETKLAESEVPAVVLKAVKDKHPGAKIDLIESVKKGPQLKEEADYFELHLTKADKKSVEVEVDAGGKILKSEEGAKD